MDTKLPGIEIKTRDAIERTAVVVVATLMEPGMPSPGPPGEEAIDDATFRVDQTLTPASAGTAKPSGLVKVSYTRRIFPAAQAETALERGKSYVLFCTRPSNTRLSVLKILPHTPETVGVVAKAFDAGARHAPKPSEMRIV